MSDVRKRKVDSSSQSRAKDKSESAADDGDTKTSDKSSGAGTSKLRPSAERVDDAGGGDRCKMQAGSYWLTRIVFTRAIGFIYCEI